MRAKILGLVCGAFLLATVTGAQTKITGKQNCGKAEVVGTADAGDKAGHSLNVQKQSCTWSDGMEMAGLKSKDGMAAAFVETWTTKTTSKGTYVGNMDNGDKFYVSFQDSMMIKDGKPTGPAKGTWSYTGGTGKLKGITGKGTYTVTPNEDGSGVVAVEGEYTIPAPAAAPAKKAPKSK